MSTNKSFSSETSERYSRALFQVADEAKELDAIESEIKIFQSLFTSSAEVRNFIHNPTQSTNTQISFIELLAKKLGFSKNLKNLKTF